MTDEERQLIVNECVEKLLLLLPDVIGNLMMEKANALKLDKQFYKDHPEFANNTTLVKEVVDGLRREYPELEYKDILSKAYPLAKQQLKVTSSLDMKTVSKPNRNLAQLNLNLSDHGEL